MGGLSVNISDAGINLSIESEAGSADTGDLEIDLPNLIVAVGGSS